MHYPLRLPNCFRYFVNNFHDALGGGRSTGFALIYDSLNDVKKFEAKYRLARVGKCYLVIISSLESRSILAREERC